MSTANLVRAAVSQTSNAARGGNENRGARDRARDLAIAADNWLEQFEHALAESDDRLLKVLFHPESYWRDTLALSWNLLTVNGVDAILRELKAHAERAKPSGFEVDSSRVAPRMVSRAGATSLEAIFKFETAEGRGCGVLRLTPDAEEGGVLKAWTLFTSLDEIKGHEEAIGLRRPVGYAHSRDFRGPNWADKRAAAIAYQDRDPTVLIVGGGQAGLSTAARLSVLGVDTLIVDREARVGDNWRHRYHALTLHNQVQANHLPYMLFPPNFPTYIPKDKLANWLETYVEHLELNFWTSTTFEGGSYDEASGRWSVTLLRADGSRRVMHPRHVVMATGVSGIPNIPDISSLENFKGTVLHSGQYRDGEDYAGKRALVIGTGNSGHDIAQDLHSSGARVTMIQRSPTLVTLLEPSAQVVYAPYKEGTVEDNDLIASSLPLTLAHKSAQELTKASKELDKDLLEGLRKKGFKLHFGENETGWLFLYYTRGGGYYFNVGCSDLIVSGDISLAQFSDIEKFVSDGARMKNGDTIPADLIILATGWKRQEELVRKLFGAAVAERIGPIWGYGDDHEMRNMFRRTAQPGLWFIAGGLTQCRINSKYIALQIKAIEEGLLPRV